MPATSGFCWWNFSTAARACCRSSVKRSVVITKPLDGVIFPAFCNWPETSCTRAGSQPVSATASASDSPAVPRRATRASSTSPASAFATALAKASRSVAFVRRAGSEASSTTPPPMVITGENWRTMKRSPGSSSNGASSLRRASPDCSGLELLTFQQAHLGNRLGGEGMQMHARAVAQRLGGGQQIQLDTHPLGRAKQSRRGQHHAARQLADLNSGKVERGALSRNRLLRGGSVDLHAAHAQSLAARMNFELVVFARRCRKSASR